MEQVNWFTYLCCSCKLDSYYVCISLLLFAFLPNTKLQKNATLFILKCNLNLYFFPDFQIPIECPKELEDYVYYEDNNDCRKFYQCHNGTLYTMYCPNNTYFNLKSHMCVSYELSGCKLSTEGNILRNRYKLLLMFGSAVIN